MALLAAPWGPGCGFLPLSSSLQSRGETVPFPLCHLLPSVTWLPGPIPSLAGTTQVSSRLLWFVIKFPHERPCARHPSPLSSSLLHWAELQAEDAECGWEFRMCVQIKRQAGSRGRRAEEGSGGIFVSFLTISQMHFPFLALEGDVHSTPCHHLLLCPAAPRPLYGQVCRG